MSSIEDSLLFLYNLIGRLVCHQLPERTLWVGGHYLPVCARDTGVYLGFFLGYILLSKRRKETCGPPNLWMTSLMVMPMIVDAGTQWVGLRSSTNELRLITGLLFGTAITPFLVYSISIISISKTVPILRRLLPKAVDFADKENWVDYKTLILGALLAIVLYVAITLFVGSTNSLFYWLLSSAVIVSVIMHIFLLPAFIIGLLLLTVYSRGRGAIIPNSLNGNSTRINEAQITALLSRKKQSVHSVSCCARCFEVSKKYGKVMIYIVAKKRASWKNAEDRFRSFLFGCNARGSASLNLSGAAKRGVL